jgi:protein-disulfide isomerase
VQKRKTNATLKQAVTTGTNIAPMLTFRMTEKRARLKPDVSKSDHAEGPADAVVTLVEFGDFECSHCGQAYLIVKDIQNRLKGKLRFVFRNFPLTHQHQHALPAAEAAEAAAAQGKFWPMHDILFEHQKRLGDAQLVRHAAKIGLEPSKFAADMETHAHLPRVQEHFDSGLGSGVHATPTFFINGVRYDQSWDVDSLTAALKAAL